MYFLTYVAKLSFHFWLILKRNEKGIQWSLGVWCHFPRRLIRDMILPFTLGSFCERLRQPSQRPFSDIQIIFWEFVVCHCLCCFPPSLPTEDDLVSVGESGIAVSRYFYLFHGIMPPARFVFYFVVSSPCVPKFNLPASEELLYQTFCVELSISRYSAPCSPFSRPRSPFSPPPYSLLPLPLLPTSLPYRLWVWSCDWPWPMSVGGHDVIRSSEWIACLTQTLGFWEKCI